MGIKYFIKAPVSEYQDKTTGETKKRNQNIGVIMETKHGLMLSLEMLPIYALGQGKLLAYLNTPEEVEASKNMRKESAPAVTIDSIDEDIPF
jgi:hypothetical protein